MLFFDDFDWLWILVNLRLTRAFWSIWPEMALRVVQRPNGLCHINLDVSTTPWRKDNIFWNFQGLAPKLRADKVWCQLLPLLYLTSLVQWEVSDKECDFAFCCPKSACENYPDKVELLQPIPKNSLTWSLMLGKRLSFYFFLFATNMLVSKQVGKHASIYFIFGIFAYMSLFFCFDHLCYDDVGKYISVHMLK